mgnify:CR=1 FL=1
MKKNISRNIFNLAKLLWPLNRSLSGIDTVKTLSILKKNNKHLKIKKINSGKKVFDWVVPEEWQIKNAWIKDDNQKKIVDFKKNNLSVVGYSAPVNKIIDLKNLKKKLHSLPNQPNAVPYVTSYYNKDWGFCISDNKKKKLKKKNYHVFIDSKFKKGHLHYGELLLKGKSKKEIFLSTYICHPSMANNELSGPCLTIFLSKWIASIKNRYYTYRIIFIPETIGSIFYISKNLKNLKKNMQAGFVITCVGDERAYSFLPSRKGNTLSDQVSKHVLKWNTKNYKKYTWLDRGSDERQYCWPGIDLPVTSVMRSKYGVYPEYHTSLDKLGDVVTQKGLAESYSLYQKIILSLEKNYKYVSNTLCEPFLSKRDLYSNISIKNNNINSKTILDILSYCDGKHSILDISDLLNMPSEIIYQNIENLIKLKLIKKKYLR